MSTSPPPAQPSPPGTPPAKPEWTSTGKIVSHCPLFYWWPVWFSGFIISLISAFAGERMVIVPEHTTIIKPEKRDGEGKLHYELVVPAKHSLLVDKEHPDTPMQPHLKMSSDKNLGVLYVTILLLVIVITNVSLRGMWSYVVIGGIVILSLAFALLHWWDPILAWLGGLEIHINAAGYLAISVVLFCLWLFVILLFDGRTYLIVTPGQLKVKLVIGGAETIYTTENMQAELQPRDFFRHYILGGAWFPWIEWLPGKSWRLGWGTMGDIIIKPVNAPEIHFPNVWHVGFAVEKIEIMLQVKEVEGR